MVQTSCSAAAQHTRRARHSGPTGRPNEPSLTSTPSTDFPWSAIPTEALLAELARRDDTDGKPKCGSGKKGYYDTGLHVFALILILVVSTLCMHALSLSQLWGFIPANLRRKQHAHFHSSPDGARKARNRARPSSSRNTSGRASCSRPHSSISSRQPSSRLPTHAYRLSSARDTRRLPASLLWRLP